MIYCEKQLEIVRTLQKKYPSSALGGSLGLIVQNVRFPKREHDIDIILKEKIVDLKNKEYKPGKEIKIFNEESSDFDCQSRHSGINCQFKIMSEFNYNTVEFEGNFYRVQPPYDILWWKLEYAIRGNSKHRIDLHYIFTNKTMMEIELYEQRGKIFKTD